jgi:epsilon-lactone hydrolase
MKKLFLFTFLLAACSHKLPLADSQSATLSPEAKAFIEKSKVTNVPSWFPISDKQIVEGRKKFNAAEAVQEQKMIAQYHLKVDSVIIANVPVLIIRPEKTTSAAIGFNIHGGGFIIGTARDRSALLVAGRLGITVYSVDYTCAPEAKYPVAINQCLSVYRELIKQFDPAHMLAISSSAGGEIMVSMIERASEEHLPLMKAQVLFTPGVDLTGNGDSGVGNDGRDVVSRKMSVRSVRDFYLGGADAKDPKVSPLYAAVPANFPATVITTGTRDLLESNGIRFFWKLQDAGIPSVLLVQEGMWHGFHWEWNMPESISTMNAVARFVEGQLGR